MLQGKSPCLLPRLHNHLSPLTCVSSPVSCHGLCPPATTPQSLLCRCADLAGCKALTSLNVVGSGLEHMPILPCFSQLRFLGASTNRLNDDALAAILKATPALRTLDVNCSYHVYLDPDVLAGPIRQCCPNLEDVYVEYERCTLTQKRADMYLRMQKAVPRVTLHTAGGSTYGF